MGSNAKSRVVTRRLRVFPYEANPVSALDLDRFEALALHAPVLADAFVTLSTDLALVIDSGGTILRVAQRAGAPIVTDPSAWVGRAWADTVTAGTRRKVEAILSEATLSGLARRREVGLLDAGGDNLPIAYTAMRLGRDGPVLAVGRDLRAVAAIQQRFIDTQQELERGYWNARQAEARYRLLFQVASDAVFTLDADGRHVREANPAAASLVDTAPSRWEGVPLLGLFDAASQPVVRDVLNRCRQGGGTAEAKVRLQHGGDDVRVVGVLFRFVGEPRLMLRVSRIAPLDPSHADPRQLLARLVDTAHEGVIVTDAQGLVGAANPAFVRLVGEASEAAVLGRSLTLWLGRVPSDVPVLIDSAREHGLAHLSRSALRGPEPRAGDVDVCAVLLSDQDPERFGFTILPREAVVRPFEASREGAYGAMLSSGSRSIWPVPHWRGLRATWPLPRPCWGYRTNRRCDACWIQERRMAELRCSSGGRGRAEQRGH